MVRISKKLSDLPKPYHPNVMKEIEKQTDRGAAIIGGSYIDLMLRELIESRLRKDAKLVAELFENRGPLQNFADRIQIGYALSLYGKFAYSDLKAIKEIRNAFAHSADDMNFDQSDISKLCHKLIYPQKIQYVKYPNPTKPRDIFIRAIELLTDGFYESVYLYKAKKSLPHTLFLGSRQASE